MRDAGGLAACPSHAKSHRREIPVAADFLGEATEGPRRSGQGASA